MKDIFRKDDGSTIIEGKKKIYTTEIPMKLLLPNGNNDGVLEKGDLIYVAQNVNKDGKEYFRFTVLKFAKTKNEKTIYFGDSNFFKKYYDNKKSNVDGEEDKNKDKKINFKVPLVTGMGFGVIGYLIANKYQKNTLIFSISGVLIGVTLGYYISNKGLNISDLKESINGKK